MAHGYEHLNDAHKLKIKRSALERALENFELKVQRERQERQAKLAEVINDLEKAEQ